MTISDRSSIRAKLKPEDRLRAFGARDRAAGSAIPELAAAPPAGR